MTFNRVVGYYPCSCLAYTNSVLLVFALLTIAPAMVKLTGIMSSPE